MNTTAATLSVLLDELGLPVSALRWTELHASPELADYTPEQLLREVIEPQRGSGQIPKKAQILFKDSASIH